jgi:hypothetical protein
VTYVCAKNINKEYSRELCPPTDQGVTFACAKKIIIIRGVTSLRTH